jgi:uncharacterized protein
MKMYPVVHFEMPYENQKRVEDFYASVFGWEHEVMGSSMGNYITVKTTDTDDKGPKNPVPLMVDFFLKIRLRNRLKYHQL